MNLPFRDDVHLLAGAYALDALDALERQRFELHLASCPTCQEDVASFGDATAALLVAVGETPPDALRRQVMSQVDQTRQASRGLRHPSGRSTLLRAVLGAVAAAAILVLGTVVVQQRHTNAQLSAQATLLKAPDLRTSNLRGAGGNIRLVYSANRGSAMLLADSLAPAPTDRTYELWFIDGGTPRPAGVFQTGDDQRAGLLLDKAPSAGVILAVTQEPKGGSKTPTSPPSHVSEPV